MRGSEGGGVEVGKERSGPREVSQEETCHCVVAVPRSGTDYATGWGWRICAKCKGFIGWGVREA